jgi:PEP-CTERM motif
MKRMMAATLGSSLLLAAPSAGAFVLQFSYVDPFHEASWEQDSEPAPIDYVLGVDTIVPIWDVAGDLLNPFDTSLVYFSADSFGGFADVYGPQVYGGSEAAPEFGVGTEYGFSSLGCCSDDGVLTITPVVSAIPEPSTWAMMLAGFAGLGALGYRASHNRAVVAA